jgi:FAD/FMN-containing dehydrogenase
MFGHWIGTAPWLWDGVGVATIALGLAGRRYAATSEWLAWVSIILGGPDTSRCRSSNDPSGTRTPAPPAR